MATPCLPSPDGLLLDFGGVIVESAKVAGGLDNLARHVAGMLSRADYDIDHEVLTATLGEGLSAMKAWRDVTSRRREPREMTHREVVSDFLASELPEGPRTLLTAEASELLADMAQILNTYEVRPGIIELLDLCGDAGIPVGVVSNSTSGLAHRRILDEFDLTDRFAVQVYSDEVGIRKPHPGIVELGSHALGLDPARVWYVGDTYDRDVVAGRGVGVGAAVVTKSKRAFDMPHHAVCEPDVVLDSPEGLVGLLREALVSSGTTSSSEPADTEPADTEPQKRPALLIDHGGVISITRKDEEALTEFASYLADRLERLSHNGHQAPSSAAVFDALKMASNASKEHKDRLNTEFRTGERADLPEIQPDEFFSTVADEIGFHDFFYAEAHDLIVRYAKAKSNRTGREGMLELFQTCRELGMPIVVVSNTVSGRTVRYHAGRYGLDPYIAAYVCSDEADARKPAPHIFLEAMTIANADPARTWFLGDKPVNDAEGALSVGIAHPVLISGGSTPREDLERFGSATVVDSPIELKDLIVSEIGRKS